MGTLDVRKLIQMGSYDRALVTVEKFEKENPVEGLILKSRILKIRLS
jgi:hypothetical protein